MVAEAQDALGGVDVLVNSAANFVAAPFDETAEEQFDLALAVNLKGPFFCAQAAAPAMIGGRLRAHRQHRRRRRARALAALHRPLGGQGRAW